MVQWRDGRRSDTPRYPNPNITHGSMHSPRSSWDSIIWMRVAVWKISFSLGKYLGPIHVRHPRACHPDRPLRFIISTILRYPLPIHVHYLSSKLLFINILASSLVSQIQMSSLGASTMTPRTPAKCRKGGPRNIYRGKGRKGVNVHWCRRWRW